MRLTIKDLSGMDWIFGKPVPVTMPVAMQLQPLVATDIRDHSLIQMMMVPLFVASLPKWSDSTRYHLKDLEGVKFYAIVDHHGVKYKMELTYTGCFEMEDYPPRRMALVLHAIGLKCNPIPS